MVAAILANTAGITIYPHFCEEEGEYSLNFYKKENCCPTKHHQVKEEHKNHPCCHKNKKDQSVFSYDKKDNCCKQESFTAQWKLNEFSFDKKIQIVAPFSFVENSFHFVLVQEQNFETNSKIEVPPLIYSGRDILVQKQSFLI